MNECMEDGACFNTGIAGIVGVMKTVQSTGMDDDRRSEIME